MNARETMIRAVCAFMTAIIPVGAVTATATAVTVMSAVTAEAQQKPPYGWRGCVVKDGKVLNASERLYCATQESPAVKRNPATSPRVGRRH
jgi:hypothetical protein